MKKKILKVAFLMLTINSFSQVGINTTLPQSILDVVSTTDGILIPRLASDPSIASGLNGEIYYNSTSLEFRYFNGTTWVPIDKSIYSSNGTLASNRVVTMGDKNLDFTSTTGNFTVDTNTFVVNPNSNIVQVGTVTTPLAKMEVISPNDGSTIEEGMRITQNKTSSTASCFVVKNVAASTAKGLEVINDGTGGATRVYQNNTASTISATLIENFGTGYGLFTRTNTGSVKPAIIATNNRGLVSINSISSYSGIQLEGKSDGTIPGYGVIGIGLENNSTSGITGTSGGFFQANQGNPGLGVLTESLVATRNGTTNYKILGVVGAPVVSTSRENHLNERVILFAPESPMPTYSDYGKGQLVNGKVKVMIDPAFANMIYVNENENADLRVIIQLEGDCKGVYVANKTNESFEVIELQGGTSNAKFTYQIVANQKDYKDPQTGIINKLQDVRFPKLDIKNYSGKHSEFEQK